MRKGKSEKWVMDGCLEDAQGKDECSADRDASKKVMEEEEKIVLYF